MGMRIPSLLRCRSSSEHAAPAQRGAWPWEVWAGPLEVGAVQGQEEARGEWSSPGRVEPPLVRVKRWWWALLEPKCRRTCSAEGVGLQVP